jgi:hypothetical protein
MHERGAFGKKILIDNVAEFGLDESDVFRVYACCDSYYSAHAASGVKIIACEIEISTKITRGFVDFICVDELGRWWIGDIKTTGWWKSLLPMRLSRDPQLNIYSFHKHELAKMLGLDVNKFAGCIYRAIAKSKHVPIKAGGKHYKTGRVYEKDETLKEFSSRSEVRCYFVHVLESEMCPGAIMQQHQLTRNHINSLKNWTINYGMTQVDVESIILRRNFNACLDYSKSCEYWSRCYGGKTFTTCMTSLNVAETGRPLRVCEVGQDSSFDVMDLDI